MEIQRYEWHENDHEPADDGGWVLFSSCEAAVEEARNEPQPGQLHPVDKAFYDTTIAERNKAWHDLDVIEGRVRKALEAMEKEQPDKATFILEGGK